MKTAEEWEQHGHDNEGVWGYETIANHSDRIAFVQAIQTDARKDDAALIRQLGEALAYSKTLIGHPDDLGLKPISLAIDAYNNYIRERGE